MSRKKSVVPDPSVSLLSADATAALLEQNPAAANLNPMVRKYGFGAEGKRCQTCRFCFGRKFSKTYYKCEHFQPGRGAVSDIRVRWDACGKYEAQTGERRDYPEIEEAA